MSKLSLYSLLAVLLPGALFSFLINIILIDSGIDIINLSNNNTSTNLALFLCASIFFGGLIHMLTMKMVNQKKYNLYAKLGMYQNVINIYTKSSEMAFTQPFFKNLCKTRFNNTHEDSLEQEGEKLYNWMYYSLEVNNNISIPKAFQSFYFFFRNLFTTCLLLLIPITSALLFNPLKTKYIIITVALLITATISVWLAIWYRKNMVQKMFWSYFSLKNPL